MDDGKVAMVSVPSNGAKSRLIGLCRFFETKEYEDGIFIVIGILDFFLQSIFLIHFNSTFFWGNLKTERVSSDNSIKRSI